MKHWMILNNLQHSTRCIERILGNKRPTDPQKELRSESTTS